MSITSPAHSDLAFTLTRHYFGETVASIIHTLFKYDQVSLGTLKSNLPDLKLAEIKKGLLILLKYQLINHTKTVHQYEYSVVPLRVFSFQRYIVQTSNVSLEQEDISIERFDRKRRDDLIIDTIHSYYNGENKIKSLCQALLDLSFDNTANDAAITAPIPITELMAVLVPRIFSDLTQLERYLSKLTSESNNRFFKASGVHPNKGPMYALDVGLAIDYLVKEHLSSRVNTKFGPKCCRVFRVLLSRGPLLLKQIEECIMLPARDVREYSYMLIKEGLIRNRQVPKTPDNAPGKSVFIMSVELDQVVYSTIDICCRSMNNLLLRYEHELSHNKPLLDRSKAVQELLGSSDIGPDEAQDDWNQYFNSHEVSQLNKINYTLDRILSAKAQVDETLFLFHSWTNIKFS